MNIASVTGQGTSALLAPWRDSPTSAGVFTDFDGTLAPIVDDPDDARPLPEAPAVLDTLANRYPVVGILSGRPVSFLQQFFSPAVTLSGVYGLELVRHGERVDYLEAEPWRPVIADAAARAGAELPEGARIESKGLSLTLHYREEPEVAATIRTWAEREAARAGLHVRSARKSVELHPPIDTDKGTALREAAGSLTAVCFIGDDLGDLPAFAVATLRVAVRSDESPAELLDQADLIVDGPAGALDFLRTLSFPRQ